MGREVCSSRWEIRKEGFMEEVAFDPGLGWVKSDVWP